MTRTDLNTWEDKQVTKRRCPPQPQQQDGLRSKLEAARNALTLVEQIPAIVELIDNAEAIKAAAKAKRISAPGINAWTRFVIDAERKAWARIEAMDGQLAKHRRPKGSELRTLSDLDESLTKQRVHEWSMLANIADSQLDCVERRANEEDRLLTRSELLALGKAGATTTPPTPKARSAESVKLIEQARGIAAGITEAKIQIDENAKINRTDLGAWVESWLWVEDPLSRSDLDDD